VSSAPEERGILPRQTQVLVAGTFDPEHTRNQVIFALLERGGFKVSVINRPLWGSKRYSLFDRPRFWLAMRAIRAYGSLFVALMRVEKPDAILVLYPGHADMALMAAFARVKGVPIVFDAFISLYDTIIVDRALRSSSSLLGRATRVLDRLACRLATLVLADTPQHADYLSELTGVSRSRFRVLWIGAEERIFAPVTEVEPVANRVLFYGYFIPLQGIDTIVKAAGLLTDDGIHIRIIGDGQERSSIEAIVRELAVENVALLGPVPLEQLPQEIAAASLCLGIFGTSPKAARVVPNKLFQCIAVGRPVLTADTPAIRSAFDGEVALVPPGDAQALADEIRALIGDTDRLRSLAAAGRARFEKDYGERPLAADLARYIREVTLTS
jgi:glycosyltransferase involved in cell wall biosynthesis